MAVSVQPVERRLEKSAQAFRTISEVATELDVPQHVLRFWESKFSQVRPLKRGGGRRYYRPEDIDLLRRIRTLLYDDGYTIKGVQRLLKEGRGRLPQQRLDLAAESALESLRIVSARAEAMAGGAALHHRLRVRRRLVRLQLERRKLALSVARLGRSLPVKPAGEGG